MAVRARLYTGQSRKRLGSRVFYTYLYTDPSRNEHIYVGKGKGKRAWDHLRCQKHDHFHNRLRKMKREGIEPVITFLATDISEDEALSLEIWFIWKYGRRDLNTGPLLNLTNGGEGFSGYIVINPSRSMLGKKHTAESKALIAGSLVGKTHTSERRHNMSIAKLGKLRGPRSAETIEKLSSRKWWQKEGEKSVFSEVSPGEDWSPGRGKIRSAV